MEPVKAEALKHLQFLDQTASCFTFQTFDDNQDRRDPKLAQIFHGSLSAKYPELVKASSNGAGVFVTVNETNLRGRKKEDIVGVRANWIEDDKGDKVELPLEPHFVVESSPGKFHKYFLVSGFGVDEFNSIQQRLIKDYGSDPNAGDISRVLRLAGFPHQKVNEKKGLKGTQFMVRVVKP